MHKYQCNNELKKKQRKKSVKVAVAVLLRFFSSIHRQLIVKITSVVNC